MMEDELKPCSEVSVRDKVQGEQAVKGECSHIIHYAHKANKVLHGLIAEHGQRGGGEGRQSTKGGDRTGKQL